MAVNKSQSTKSYIESSLEVLEYLELPSAPLESWHVTLWTHQCVHFPGKNLPGPQWPMFQRTMGSLLPKDVWVSCILDLSPYPLFCPQKSVDISWLKVLSNCIVYLPGSVRYENKVVPTGNSSISRNLCVVWDLNTNKKILLSLGKHQRFNFWNLGQRQDPLFRQQRNFQTVCLMIFIMRQLVQNRKVTTNWGQTSWLFREFPHSEFKFMPLLKGQLFRI